MRPGGTRVPPGLSQDTATNREAFESLDETPIDPQDVASAARSCSALLIVLAIIVLLLCFFGAVAVVNR